MRFLDYVVITRKYAKEIEADKTDFMKIQTKLKPCRYDTAEVIEKRHHFSSKVLVHYDSKIYFFFSFNLQMKGW